MTLPHSNEVERYTIGALIQDAGAMDLVRGTLAAEDFLITDHARMWKACCRLYDAGGKVELVSLFEELQREKAPINLTQLLALTDGLPAGAPIANYANILREKATRRRAILEAHKLISKAQDETEPLSAVLDGFNAAAMSLTEAAAGSQARPVSTADLIALVGVDRLLAPRKRAAVSLPWPKLNQDLGGFGAEQMIVLMAQTSRGKTSAALQVVASAAAQGCAPVVWTMEMSPESLFRRLVAQMSGVRPSPRMSFEESNAVRDAVARLNDYPVYFDRSSRTVSAFAATIRRIRAQARVGIAVVDYLQLIRSEARGAATRAQEVSANSRALKLLAMDLGIPVLVLSQVDRGSVKNGGEIGLHSAKESGDIENDADVMLWIQSQQELARDADTAVTMWVGKQREGSAGFGVPMVFRPQSQIFLEVGA